MADFNKYFPKLLAYEGGYAGNIDGAICTNLGITLATWKQYGHDLNGDWIIDCEDIKLLTPKLVSFVYKLKFWDKWKADQIENQSIAELLVDWEVNSGVPGIEIPQGILGVVQDGIVGNKTISAINDYPLQHELFQKIWDAHENFYTSLVNRKPTNQKFLQGWLNRLDKQIFVA